MTISGKSAPGLRNRNGLRQELTGGRGNSQRTRKAPGKISKKVLGNEVKEMGRGLHVGN